MIVLGSPQLGRLRSCDACMYFPLARHGLAFSHGLSIFSTVNPDSNTHSGLLYMALLPRPSIDVSHFLVLILSRS
jgi:hypothetical protein